MSRSKEFDGKNGKKINSKLQALQQIHSFALFSRIQKKDELQEILDEYDTKMIELQNKLEYLSGLHEHEKRELERYKVNGFRID